MRTRSSSNLVGESSPNPTTSNPKRRNRRRSKQPFSLEESPLDTMADQRTMAELLRAPTEGYAEAIVVPPILAEHFELKNSLINMITSDQFFGLKKDNPHDYIYWFNKITSTIKYKDVPNSAIKLMLFPFSLTGAARRWLEKEPPRSILTWEDLDLLHACLHYGFIELHQLDTFYNALNPADQDSLNSAAGGNLLERRTQDVLTIIENKSKVRNSRNKSIVSQVKSSDVNSYSSSKIAKLTHVVNQQTSAVTTTMTTIPNQFQATPPPASVKAVEEICVTCGGAHPYYQYVKNELRNEMQTSIQASMSNQTNELKNMMASFFQMNTASSSGSGSLPGNTIANPKGELKAITTRSGLVLDGPSVPMPPPFINPEEDERAEETLTDPELAEYTIKVPPPLVQKAKPPSLRNYVVHQRDPRHPHIPYPSRMNQEKQQDKDEIQIHKFWQMFKQLHINITLADALILIPKYQKMLKSLLSNKEKLLELANTPLNENCSAVILKKLPEKLGDPGKFLIPCGFSELKCKALADLGASINLMPLSKMSLSVGKFTFPADFVIVDYESDPRVPLILGRPFLRTARALIAEYTIAITPVLPTKEPDNSLSMRDEHLSTIPKTKSDELIKSSVENLVPTLNEFEDLSKDLSDIESECDVPVCDNFTTFSNHLFDADDDFSSSDDELFSDEDVPKEIYSNPLFDEEIISTKIDPHHFNAESDLIESLLNRDTLIISSPKFDSLLEEFSGELAHIDLIPPGINETDFDPEEEIRLVEKLLYDNSSPRHPKEFNSEYSDAIIESLSPSPIPVEDSDSLMEDIDLFLTPNDSIPPGIENDDYDSEGDILFLEELLSNDPLSLSENESFHFDRYYVPSSPRPPEKPPDEDEIEPDTRVLTTKVVISDFSESPMMIYGEDIPILDVPIAPDYEASRARGFVLCSLELQSLA
ncbi:hypothetical protein Tco_0370083 [Tanacetum coccineum]